MDEGNQICQDSSGNSVLGGIGGAIAQRAQTGLILYDPTTATMLADSSGAESFVAGSFTPGNLMSFQMRLSTTNQPPAPLYSCLAQFPFGITAGNFYATSLLLNNSGAIVMANGVQNNLFPGNGQTIELVDQRKSTMA